MGYRISEMTNRLAKRDLRMKTQVQEMSIQIQAKNTALQREQPTVKSPEIIVKARLQERNSRIKRMFVKPIRRS